MATIHINKAAAMLRFAPAAVLLTFLFAVSAAAAPIAVRLPTMTTPGVPVQFQVPVLLDSDITGDNVSSYQFNVLYDPNIINADNSSGNYCDTAGTRSGATGMGFFCNVTEPGRLRVSAFDTPPFLTGSGILIKLNFAVAPTAASGSSSFLNFETAPVDSVLFFSTFTPGGVVADTTTNGSVTIVGPTSAPASVSGRVTTADGTGVTNAVVTMTDASGATRSARSSGFGYYRFDDVATGATYVMGVQSKRYQFQPRTVTVSEEIANVDFAAQP